MKKPIGLLLLATIGCTHQESGLATPGVATSAICSATPRAVIQLDGEATSLAYLNDRLYLTAADTLWAIDPASGTKTAVATGDTIFAADGDTLVWTDGERHSLHALRGGAPVDLGVALADFTGSYSMPLRGVAGGSALWADGTTGGGAYLSLSLDGGVPVAHRLSDGWTYATSWIAGGGRMAWIADGSLWIANAPAADARVQLDAEDVQIIGLTANDVYVQVGDAITALGTDGSSRTLTHTTLSPEVAECSHQVGKYGISTIEVAGDERVYLASWADCLDGTFAISFWRADETPTRLAGYTTQGQSALFAVDDACLYYPEAGVLMTVAR